MLHVIGLGPLFDFGDAVAVEWISVEVDRFRPQILQKSLRQTSQVIPAEGQMLDPLHVREEFVIQLLDFVVMEPQVVRLPDSLEGPRMHRRDLVVHDPDVDHVIRHVLEGGLGDVPQLIFRHGEAAHFWTASEPVRVDLFDTVEVELQNLQLGHVVESARLYQADAVVLQIEEFHLEQEINS